MCEACCGVADDSHHIVSRGAGGGDEDWNLMPLCRRCHREVHTLGWVEFVKRNPRTEQAVRRARDMAGRPVVSRVPNA